MATGYLIPKGWKVMPLFRNIHHNPEFFADPQKFDLSRFEVWTVQYYCFPIFYGVAVMPNKRSTTLIL